MPQAFIERCNKVPGIKAEIAKIGGTPELFESPYRVLVDRLSHELSLRLVNTAPQGGTIITDDRNPIDLARARTALAWRSQTMDLLK